MGIPAGEFETILGDVMHVEVSSGMVIIYLQSDERGPAIRMTANEARKAADALSLAADIEEGV